MKKLLKYVDRRVLIMLLVTVVVFVGLNLTWVRAASTRLETNRRDQAVAETGLNELRSRLSDIRADGVTSSQALLSRLERLESLLPFSADDISISQIVIASAESAGVTLERFQPAVDQPEKQDSGNKDNSESDEKPKDPSVVGGLKSYRYDFKVTGSYLAVSNFLNTTVASRAVVVTFDGLYIYSGSKANNPTVFDELVSVEGQLLIWTSLEKHLSTGSKTTASGDDVTTTVPPTTVPGSTSPDSVPADSTAPTSSTPTTTTVPASTTSTTTKPAG